MYCPCRYQHTRCHRPSLGKPTLAILGLLQALNRAQPDAFATLNKTDGSQVATHRPWGTDFILGWTPGWACLNGTVEGFKAAR
jgi:hypothetical protein